MTEISNNLSFKIQKFEKKNQGGEKSQTWIKLRAHPQENNKVLFQEVYYIIIVKYF